MINLNSGSQKSKNPQSDTINEHIDAAIVAKREAVPRRKYLGASMLGKSCARAVQYEFLQTKKDPGSDFSARVYRIFQMGHELEEDIVQWFRDAGFDLRNEKPNGEQFGFETAGGLIQGHIDGVFCGAPEGSDLTVPCLWECKSANQSKFNSFKKHGVKKANPQYYAQANLYMAYMELSDAPAVFTVINKNDAEIYHELIPFDAEEAQRISDRAVNIIQAGETLLPRVSDDPGWFECRWCSYQKRCFNVLT
jgi:hypothetical protein